MKSYTDLNQSKKLAEFLPLESADMWWNFYSVTTDDTTPQIIHLDTPWVGNFNWDNEPDNVPGWSLAALLNALPKAVDNETLYIETSAALWHIGYRNVYTARAENLVDACYEMILLLHEQKLL